MVVDGSFSLTTTDDLDMLESTASEQRPSLPTSLSDFALFQPSSSAPSTPASNTPEDGLSPFFRRLRRSSLLATHPITADFDVKPTSPLATSVTSRFNFDLDKMYNNTSEPPSAAPSLLFENVSASSDLPSTPPRRTSSPVLAADPLGESTSTRRRVSLPPKPARLLDLRNEVRSPIESELKSEAQFQRLIASYSSTGLPPSKHLPRTRRAWTDRGRYPEEAGGDDDGSQGAESASDEGEDEAVSANASTSASASTSITPSGSGEEQPMTIDTTIVGPFMMDVDVPSAHSAMSSPTQWRQTPPPTVSSTRPNKRKFDDRYDPYPSAAKRRAVSPSVHPHHSHSHSHSHHSHAHGHSHAHSHSHSHPHHLRSTPHAHGHSASPISIPVSRPRSVTSSPVMRPTSSPIMRPTSFPGHSPVLKGASPTIRPIARLTLRGGSDGERERERSQRGVDGAGEAVGSLSIA